MLPTFAASAPWETLVVCLLLLAAPAVAVRRLPQVWQLPGLAGTLAVALLTTDATLAYLAIAAGALLHAASAWRQSRTGAVTLMVSAVATAGCGLALLQGAPAAAFWLSCLALAFRLGTMPFHGGVASLCDRAPLIQTQQLSSAIALVFIHLRFVDHHAAAVTAAPVLVWYGAVAGMAGALMALVQRDVRGFYRCAATMHGGIMMAAIGVASLGNFAAALLVTVATGLALGGLGMMITALEDRTGAVSFSAGGGYSAAFPRLAALFAFFGGAGVGLPGTAGFVADDLILHTLWLERPATAIIVILAHATLAVATLITFGRVFMGRARPSLAPDLDWGERAVAVGVMVLLVVLGLDPGLVLEPADALLGALPALAPAP